MGVYKAKDENKKDDVYRGASGGLTPEGYGFCQERNIVDGVETRSEEEENKRLKSAEEFQKSKLKESKPKDSEVAKEDVPKVAVVPEKKVEPVMAAVVNQVEKDKK